MIKQLVNALGTAGVCLALAGCGRSDGLASVSGHVLYRGQPAAGAVVYFHRAGNATDSGSAIPSGIVEDDGGFFLFTDGLGAGAPPGKYHVLVAWPDAAGDGTVPVKSRGKVKLVKRSRVRSGPDRIHGRYFDIGHPLLHAEVNAGSNALAPFELSD